MALAERKRSGKDKDSKKLSPRQAIFLKHIAKGRTYADAAIAAGYSPKLASQSGSQALEQIKHKVPDILDRKGLTDDAVIERYLIPALEANNKALATFEGKFTDERDVPNWTARTNALDMLWNLKGAYAPKAVVQNNTLIANFDEGERARIQDTMEKIRKIAEAAEMVTEVE